jgi:DNA-binding response OmpR family regulator
MDTRPFYTGTIKNQEGTTMTTNTTLQLDYGSRRVLADGRATRLTRTEFQIMTLLADCPGQVVSYRTICETVWGKGLRGCDNTLKVNISNIRRKLGDAGRRQYIKTVVGVGYRLG